MYGYLLNKYLKCSVWRLAVRVAVRHQRVKVTVFMVLQSGGPQNPCVDLAVSDVWEGSFWFFGEQTALPAYKVPTHGSETLQWKKRFEAGGGKCSVIMIKGLKIASRAVRGYTCMCCPHRRQWAVVQRLWVSCGCGGKVVQPSNPHAWIYGRMFSILLWHL
jgi:hypothetical protein